MRKGCTAVFLVMLISAICPTIVVAQGLLGVRHIGFEVGLIRPGNDDLKEVDEAIFFLAAGAHVPVTENLDISLGVSRQSIEGPVASLYGVADVELTALSISAGGTFHFTPESQYDPFLGLSVAYIESETNFANFNDSDTRTGWYLSAGVECRISTAAALTPSLIVAKVDDTDDVLLNLSINNWFSETLGAGLAVNYGTDEGDCGIGLAVFLAL